ncbi:YfiR family protein [Verrucomicrobia bacterium]|jgi:hypothetical protein|nr:YfiR family protein [Verrucomicrobiota bacterium]MDA7644726.1 YfiR family protein [bacterium]MDA7657822.1 YfiR family protein [Verrucomicrobiota bacterium]MDA7680156.1 YfiR family protein [bacterium]
MTGHIHKHLRSIRSRVVFALLECLSFRSAIFFALLLTGTSIASQNALKEGEAKGLLLYNFAKFTTWPSQAFTGDHSPLIVGVIGPNPFGNILNDIKGKKVKGRKIEVRHFDTPRDYSKSHILFCNVRSARALKDLIEELDLEAQHVLTVGDFSDFALNGGVIGLTFSGNRLALEINQKAAKRAKIYLSENLVRLAKRVY